MIKSAKFNIILLCFFMTPSYGWGSSLAGSFKKNFAHLKSELSKKELSQIKVGYSLFAKPWVQAPSSTKRRDGLGPHFNAVSCISCHPALGRGAPPHELHRNDPALIFKSASAHLEIQYGKQITPKAIGKVHAEGEIRVLSNHRRYFDALTYSWKGKTRESSKSIKVSPRIAPHLAGLGDLQMIPAKEILKNQKNGGRLSMVRGNLARFGWKAEQIDLLDQVAAAFSNDMGITSYLYPNENCQPHDSICSKSSSGADEEKVEIRKDHLMMVVKLISSIEAPKPLKSGLTKTRGYQLFDSISCTSCHRAEYKLNNNKTIRPYTDLLLHDMGEGLADHSDLPNRALWRTPPLWGLGSQKIVNGHTRLLHDGRAKNIEEAILWHDGEAQRAKENYKKLSSSDQKELITFLKSL